MTTIKIQQIRKHRGMTLRRLESLTGISRSQLSRIENNESMPNIDELCDIAHALNVPVDDTYEYHYVEKNPQSG